MYHLQSYLSFLSRLRILLSLTHTLHQTHVMIVHLNYCFFFSSEWVLWEHVGGGGRSPKDWKENMKPICTFSTIEDFWRYFNHVPKPSQVFYDGENRKVVGPTRKSIEEYSLFKKGILPQWEDEANKTGGEWFIRQTLDMDVLDMYWQNLVLGCIGESIEDGADSTENKTSPNVVNGARVVDKGKGYPMFRLELWLNSRDADMKEQVKTKLVECVTNGLPPNARKGPPKFDWKDHS